MKHQYTGCNQSTPEDASPQQTDKHHGRHKCPDIKPAFHWPLKCTRKDVFDITQHKQTTPAYHMEVLYEKVLNTDEPWGLLYKVIFEVTLYFVRCAREGQMELTRENFQS